jgi:hypothetical protein
MAPSAARWLHAVPVLCFQGARCVCCAWLIPPSAARWRAPRRPPLWFRQRRPFTAGDRREGGRAHCEGLGAIQFERRNEIRGDPFEWPLLAGRPVITERAQAARAGASLQSLRQGASLLSLHANPQSAVCQAHAGEGRVHRGGLMPAVYQVRGTCARRQPAGAMLGRGASCWAAHAGPGPGPVKGLAGAAQLHGRLASDDTRTVRCSALIHQQQSAQRQAPERSSAHGTRPPAAVRPQIAKQQRRAQAREVIPFVPGHQACISGSQGAPATRRSGSGSTGGRWRTGPPRCWTSLTYSGGS